MHAVTEIASVIKSATLFRRQRGALPQTLIFFVTSRCNARCSFCLYYDQITSPVAKSRELRVDEVERIAASYGPLHYLALSGGEPFVRRDVAALCRPFIERCDTGVVDIPSNFWFGDHMVDALAPLCADYPDVVFDIQLSLDHVGARHDQSRRVPGLYDRAAESFARLAEVRARHPNLKLKVNLVYLEDNRDDLAAIARRVRADFDSDRMQLTYPHAMLPATGSEDPEALASVDRFEEAAERLADAVPVRRLVDLHTLGVRSVKHVYHRLLREAVAGERATGSYCEAGKHLVVLDEKGEVFPCEPLFESIGNVRENDYDIGRVLRSEAYRDFRRRRLGDAGCNCTWSCAMNTHVSVEPRLLPSLGVEAGRIAVEHLLRKVRAGGARR